MKKQIHLHLGWPDDVYILAIFPFLGELLNHRTFLLKQLDFQMHAVWDEILGVCVFCIYYVFIFHNNEMIR